MHKLIFLKEKNELFFKSIVKNFVLYKNYSPFIKLGTYDYEKNQLDFILSGLIKIIEFGSLNVDCVDENGIKYNSKKLEEIF